MFYSTNPKIYQFIDILLNMHYDTYVEMRITKCINNKRGNTIYLKKMKLKKE